MKATPKQVALLKKLNKAYTDEVLKDITKKQASKLIGILLDMSKAWRTAMCSSWHYSLVDDFYDAEEEIFGREFTPAGTV